MLNLDARNELLVLYLSWIESHVTLVREARWASQQFWTLVTRKVCPLRECNTDSPVTFSLLPSRYTDEDVST